LTDATQRTPNTIRATPKKILCLRRAFLKTTRTPARARRIHRFVLLARLFHLLAPRIEIEPLAFRRHLIPFIAS